MNINSMDAMLSKLSEGFFLNQVLTIVMIFLVGFLFLYLLNTELQFLWHCLLAFPIGLSLWGLISFGLLVCGIRYVPVFIFTVLLVLLLVLAIKNHKRLQRISWQPLMGALLIVIVLAVVSVSGLMSVSVSNDSVYYYSVYPEAIVKAGFYRASFDVFLTDVGQTTALINCLPYFFHFDETFGIQHFFNLNFCGIFCLAVYETIRTMTNKKNAAMIGGIATVFLITTTPFLITSKWVLANVYFMDFMFLIFYLAQMYDREDKKSSANLVVLGMLIAMLSQMRMEGGMIACFLILCISSLGYKNRELLLGLVLPVAVMQISYYLMLFVRLKVDPLYSFLDMKKAAIMIALLVAVAGYLLLFRKRHLLFLTNHIKGVILTGLLVGNLGLCVINPERFITNLKCFGQNIILQNGWGYFGLMVLIFLLVLPITKEKLSYFDLFVVGYILFTIAVCWARGATLRIGIGDSGNRVMMQIVPFVVFDMTIHLIRVIICGKGQNQALK